MNNAGLENISNNNNISFYIHMNMDYTYIQQLLDKYFECETSLGEEQVLRAFFAQDDVPVQFMAYRQLFRDMAEKENNEALDSTFDDRIMSIIAAEETPQPIHVKARMVTMQRRLRPLYKAAAVVAVVLALGQAAQMPYSEDTEEQENIARVLQKPQVEQGEAAVAKTDSTATQVTNKQTPIDTPVQN